jgi:KUP system potassium uptake protein
MVKPLSAKLEPGAPEEEESLSFRRLMWLTLLAFGVVYGDLGTNCLFVFKTVFSGKNAIPAESANILGVVSLVFWSLIIVVSIKYAIYVMNADNLGEGGVMALMSLIHPGKQNMTKSRWLLITIGLFGATILYGDCMVTGAISVLSAVEGLDVATKVFSPYIVPITLVIIVLLYSFQRHGTRIVGFAFGPIMIAWFLTIAVLGVSGIARRPEVLAAINPAHAVAFFSANGWHGFVLLGIVFLSVCGAEALFADKGHFGNSPIRLGWFALVLPALCCNYFGQGAYLMENPQAAQNPFFMMAPSWALYPLVGLATAATAIASQAVITGSFSITRQAIQLGYLPRMKIEHTSRREIGQVYLGTVNWLLMIATLGLVVGFQKSTNLANAYGVDVSAAMLVDTILASVVMYERWRWPKFLVVAIAGLFLIPDTAFFVSNLTKVPAGGWFPLLVGGFVFFLSLTWRRGRDMLRNLFKEQRIPVEKYLEDFRKNPSPRVPGTAVYLTGTTEGVPGAILIQLRHYHAMFERAIFLTLINEPVPRVSPKKERLVKEDLGQNFFRVIARQGFMEKWDMSEIFKLLNSEGLMKVKMDETSFFIGRANIIPDGFRMNIASSKIFAFMERNALGVSEFIRIPPERVIELGAYVEI